MKSTLKQVIHPLRPAITWACQRGLLTPNVRRVLPWTWACEPFRIHDYGCNWYPSGLDGVGHEIFWSGFRRWEAETAPAILNELRRASCFIDVGANTGIYSVLGAWINPALRVFAVEPVPAIYANLVANIAGNGLESKVTPLNMALSDTVGRVPFHAADCATMGSLAVNGYQGVKGEIIHVESRTLDSLVADFDLRPDFVKIDVEGFEHVVLAGAGETLSRHRPRIILEANPGDPSPAETLLRQGYVFDIITDQGPLRRATIEPDDRFRNWLCTPS